MIAGGGSTDARNSVSSAVFSTISGGEGNQIFFNPLNVIGGGSGNENSGSVSTISGGQNNKIGFDDPNEAEPVAATIGGGDNNQATGTVSSISGGTGNRATNYGSAIGGGVLNIASGFASVVAGGNNNIAIGDTSVIGGGTLNCAGASRSWAGGYRAKVRPAVEPAIFGTCSQLTYPGGLGDQGTFVWADSQDANFVSTGSNQFLIRAQGGVGIGTNAPRNQLHVIESINDVAAAQNHVVQIHNTSTGISPDVLALRVGRTVDLPNSISFITFIKGDNTGAGSIRGNGAGGIEMVSTGSDYAEWLPLRDPEQPVQPGDIVGWTSEGIGHSTADALRIMVISTSPIVVGNAPPDGDESAGAVAAFVGQVPVRVRGPVRAGDFIVPSGLNDGTAVAVAPEAVHTSQIGRIAGRTLESGEGDDVHRINALVGLPHEGLLQAQLARLEQENATLHEQLAQERAGTEARLARLESLLGEGRGHD